MIFELLIAGVGALLFAPLLYTDRANKICQSKELRDLMGDGLLCSKKVRLSVNQSNEHALMVAPSGAGKSRSFIMPNVDELEDCTLIVTDPSCEICKECTPDKKKYIFNPFSNNSIGYDPLLNCKSEFEVRKIAKTILANGMVQDNKHQKEWVDMATPLLAAYMLFNYHTKKYSFAKMVRNICTAPIIEKDEPCICGEIFSSNIKSAKVEMAAFMQVFEAKQTLSSIRTVLNTCLQVFLDDSVQALLEKPNIDFSAFRKMQSVLYIQIPERHADYYAPLTATLITQLLDRLLDEEGLQVYMLFDEFANVGQIPYIGKLLSTARKHRICIVAAIQSIAQFERVYGDAGIEIKELFKTLLITGGLRQSAEYVANLLGVEIDNKTGQAKPLMTADEVRRLGRDEILILCNNKRPVLDRMLDRVVA